MPINIQNAPVAQEPKSPHAEAADAIETIDTQVSTTVSDISDGKDEVVKEYDHKMESPPHQAKPDLDQLTVEMQFKWPIAQYTILGYRVSITKQFDPQSVSQDAVFDQSIAWVDNKVNTLIEAQAKHQAEQEALKAQANAQ